MAARLEGYTTETAVLGGNAVMKVHAWRCYSEPSNTYFEFRARTNVTTGEAQSIADGVSDIVEAVLGFTEVTDVAWSQDVTPSGQLIGVFTVYWHDVAQNASGWVEVPYTKFTQQNVAEAIIADVGFPAIGF